MLSGEKVYQVCQQLLNLNRFWLVSWKKKKDYETWIYETMNLWADANLILIVAFNANFGRCLL